MTPIQQLDEVLRFLSKERGNISLISLKDRMNQNRIDQVDGDILLRILRKLFKDGYVDFEDFPVDDNVFHSNISERRYAISFDGKYFINEMDGYRQKQKDEILNREKTLIDNRQNRLNQKLLTIGAIGAAVGAICLVLWEMYKYYHLRVR